MENVTNTLIEVRLGCVGEMWRRAVVADVCGHGVHTCIVGPRMDETAAYFD